MPDKKSHALFDDNITCPYCSKQVHVKIEKQILEPAVPAQTRIEVYIDKSSQKTLKESKG